MVEVYSRYQDLRSVVFFRIFLAIFDNSLPVFQCPKKEGPRFRIYPHVIKGINSNILVFDMRAGRR